MEWKNEDPGHRLREAEKSNDSQQVRQIEIKVSRSVRREIDREFFRMPVPREPSSPAKAHKREDIYARLVVMGVGRDFPEVMEENTRYINSEIRSSYRRRVDALMSPHRIRVEEQERIERQEQERSDRYRQISRTGRRRNERLYRRDREGDDVMSD